MSPPGDLDPITTNTDVVLRDSYPSTESTYRKRTTRQERLAQATLRNEVQALVDTADAPFFEVAGPTRVGFTSLDGVTLRHGVTISNIYPTAGVDVMADVRQLPLANKSIGGLLVSCLVKLADSDCIDPWTGYVDTQAISGIYGVTYELYGNTLRGDYKDWHDKELHNYALRVALLSEARRVLQPGGLLIMRGTEDLELEVAHHLGFDHKLDISGREDLPLKARADDNEHVLQLNRMQTGAGLTVESRSF